MIVRSTPGVMSMARYDSFVPSAPQRSPLALWSLGGWLLLCFAVASLGALASVNAVGFYAQLVQPSWAPPAWVFGPAWSLLFTLMAFAAWLAGRGHHSAGRTRALALFVLQLALNALWSWLFFAWHRGGWAFFEVLVFWAAILATLLSFWRRRPLAGMLLLPYIAWVSFAAVLNATLWRLNPVLLG
jgi:tryptophan-rich sensory protein